MEFLIVFKLFVSVSEEVVIFSKQFPLDLWRIIAILLLGGMCSCARQPLQRLHLRTQRLLQLTEHEQSMSRS